MAWAFVGVSNVVEVTTTSHALVTTGISGTLQAGDLLIACISSRIASTTSITLPTGGAWTLVSEQKNNNTATNTSATSSGLMACCIRGASNPNLTFTHPTAPSVGIGRIIAYRGADQSSPKDTQISATTATNTTVCSITGLTTAQANELIVVAACGGQEAAWSSFDATNPSVASGATDTTTAPTANTWIERVDSNTTTGADTSLAIADAIRSTAGATGNLLATASLGAAHVIIAGAFKIDPTTPVVGTAAGTSTASSDGAATNEVTGSTAGVAAATAQGAGIVSATGSTAGVGGGTAVGEAPTYVIVSWAQVEATDSGAAATAAVGTAAGAGATTGAGAQTATSTASNDLVIGARFFSGTVSQFSSTPLTTAFSQSFLASGPIAHATFWLDKSGTPTLTVLYAKIYLADGSHFPTGSALATSNPIDNSAIVSDGNANPYRFDFPTSFNAQPATRYCLVLERTGDFTGGTFNVEVTEFNEYPDGLFSRNPAGVWTAFPSARDIRCRIGFVAGQAGAVGAAVTESIGVAAGAGTASAAAQQIDQSTASSVGLGAASGAGVEIAATTAAASGVGAASAVGHSVIAVTAAASGAGAANVVGSTGSETSEAVGTAVGTATATAGGAQIDATTASSAGLGAASGTGRQVTTAVASAAGLGSAAAATQQIASTTAPAIGAGAASAVGAEVSSSGVGTASGVGQATGITTGAAISSGAGDADGAGAASAIGAQTATTAASAAGTGAANAVGFAHSAVAVGTASGLGGANAVGAQAAASIATASGTGTATAISGAIGAAAGAASGVGSAVGEGFEAAVVFEEAAGSATATGTASGVGFAIQPSATAETRIIVTAAELRIITAAVEARRITTSIETRTIIAVAEDRMIEARLEDRDVETNESSMLLAA